MNWQPVIDEVDSSFFDRDVDVVARDLIGRKLRVSDPDGSAQFAVIVESEAYGDTSDPASHAAFRPGGRALLMAGPPGSVYVYSAYGMYPCLNFVTSAEGVSSAVLIRGVWRTGDTRPVLGPGRTTRLLRITAADHGEVTPGNRFGIGRDRRKVHIDCTPRIGITRATQIKWRFVADIGDHSIEP
ncbi:DNA-3-methyladenine glycosylase [soil metagenome]